jgi:hypothetical protein
MCSSSEVKVNFGARRATIQASPAEPLLSFGTFVIVWKLDR